jgi:hypothetical protein
MTQCSVCGEALAPGSWTCALCGTTMPQPVADLAPPLKTIPSSLPQGELLAPDTRLCPGCGKTYGRDYTDTFCTCGMELFGAEQLPAAIVEETPAEEADANQGMIRPAAGTQCLVLYDAQKQPLHYFPLDKDALLIGRLDAVAGNFPDIDVTEWLEAAQARKVSRKHALVLRSRATGALLLRPLAGNTGTQVDSELLAPLSDCLLGPGRRIILGGAVRFKFEIM